MDKKFNLLNATQTKEIKFLLLVGLLFLNDLETSLALRLSISRKLDCITFTFSFSSSDRTSSTTLDLLDTFEFPDKVYRGCLWASRDILWVKDEHASGEVGGG